MFKTLCFLLLTVAPANEIKTAENPVPMNSFAEASVTLTEGDAVLWLISPEPVKIVEVDNKVYFSGPGGTYTVVAIIITAGEKKVTTKKYKASVLLTDPVPPKPPTPPVPPSSLQSSFDLDVDSDKLDSAAKLAAIYRTALTTALGDPTVKTYGDLFDVMKRASRALLGETAIPNTRKAIGAQLNPLMSNADATIDAPKVRAAFNSIADSLSALK